MTTSTSTEAGSSGALATVIAAELAKLADLAEWEPVAKRALAIADALRGGEGVTSREVASVRNAARRWTSLNPRLRVFYAAAAPTNPDASFVLYQMIFLGARRSDLWRGPLVRRVNRIWEEMYGAPSPMTLYPLEESHRE